MLLLLSAESLTLSLPTSLNWLFGSVNLAEFEKGTEAIFSEVNYLLKKLEFLLVLQL